MRHRSRLHECIVRVGLCVALVAAFVSVPDALGDEPLKVRLAQVYEIANAATFDPLFVERAKKYGIEVEMVPVRRYGDVQLALASGDVEFGVLGFFSIGTMADNNIANVKLISGTSTGGQGLVVRKGLNAKVKSWKDLEGLKIGVAPNGGTHNIFRTLAREKGVDLSKVQQVSFAGMGPEAVQALKTGDIDALLSWEPTDARAVVEGIAEYSTLKLEESATGNINGALAVNTAFASQHPDVVLNIVRTVVETTDYLNANRDQWISLASAKTGVSPAVVMEAIKHCSIHYEMPESKTKAFMQVMAGFGVTKKDYSDLVDRYMDYSYLEKATGKNRKQLGGQ
jgi:ABC-type nitrate/sulfonate/bicarbonate transport system substrate-binding protein